MRTLGLILCLLLFWAPVLTAAVTYYVDGSGAPADNSWSGTTAVWTAGTDGPWLTGSGAAASVSPGDTVHVAYATYLELVEIVDELTTWSGDTTGAIFGTPGYFVIDGEKARNNCVTWDVQSVTISGFSVQSAIQSGIFVNTNAHGAVIMDCYGAYCGTSSYAPIYLRPNNVTAWYNTIGPGSGGGIRVGGNDNSICYNHVFDINRIGISIASGLRPIVCGNLVERCDIYAAYGQIELSAVVNANGIIRGNILRDSPSSYGIRGLARQGDVIDSNIITGNTLAGIYTYASTFSGSMRNNFIYGNKEGISFSTSHSIATPDQVIVSNNLIAFNAQSSLFNAQTGVSAKHNLFWGNGTDDPSGPATFFENTIANPQIADANTGETWSYSPVWTAGTDAAGLQAATDFNGLAWLTTGNFAHPIGHYRSTTYFGPEPLPPTPPPTITPVKTPTPRKTATPPPTRTPTPVGYKTPVPPATPKPAFTPTPTPDGFKTPTPPPTPPPSPTPIDFRIYDRSGAGRYAWVRQLPDGYYYEVGFASATDAVMITDDLAPTSGWFATQYGPVFTGWIKRVGREMLTFNHPPTCTPTPSVTATPTTTPTPVIDTCWSSFGRGITDGIRARTISYDPSGNIYIGGDEFNEVGYIKVKNIAMWNGSSWSALSSGLNLGPRQISYDPIDGVMLVGGGFTNVGNRVATWDGSEWGQIGTGFNGWVRSIFRHTDGKIYAAGEFTQAEGGEAKRIAVWDGLTWEEVGGGVNGNVYYMYSHKATGNIYIGGDFTQVGGWNDTTGIAMWTGETWVGFGSGIGGIGHAGGSWVFVHAIEYDDGRGLLYVGGLFSEVSGVSANNIAAWNGVSWSALSSGTTGGGDYDGAVYGIALGADNRLYCGGYFQSAGGVSNTGGIARWTGAEWQAVENGLTENVRWIEAMGSEMLVGGEFVSAGDVTLNKVGRYNISCEPTPTPSPSPSITPTPSVTATLTPTPTPAFNPGASGRVIRRRMRQ